MPVRASKTLNSKKELHMVPRGSKDRKVLHEILLILISCIVVFLAAQQYDALEHIVAYSSQHEGYELDELLTVAIFLVFAMTAFTVRRWREQVILNKALNDSNNKLKEALAEIRHLKDMTPICSSCKNIRDEEGCWHQLESYILEHTGSKFSHGICPECREKLYPDAKIKKSEGDFKHSG